MSREHSETPALAEEAAQWLIELEEADDGTLRRFAAWLETSPRHVEEFLLASAVWKELDNFDRARRLDIDRLVDEARNNVRPLAPAVAETSDSSPQPTRGRRYARVAVAAGLVVAIVMAGLGLWSHPMSPARIYETARGEQRTLKLEDGSVVYLNTQSRVELRFSKNVRAIRLLDGEAMFNVAHDAARPFRVTAGATVIQAIGTRFNVYRNEAGATVSVVEGVVQISPETAATGAASPPVAVVKSRVIAGEQARVLPDGEIVKRAVPDVAVVVAWRERRLVFRAEPLADVAAQFNRYNAVQIHVAGDALRGKQITGVFDADDPRSFIQFLERDGTLSIESGVSEISIRPKP